MDRETFTRNLKAATGRAVEFARQFVVNRLGTGMIYFVEPNQSFDEKLRDDERTFPDDSLPDGERHGPWSAQQVVDFLWRDGCVPEWIDISVTGAHENEVWVGLKCCGRFTAREDLLYYTDREAPPFGVKSPVFPPRHREGEKFDVNWSEMRG